jgi:hypothetical protein
MTPELSPELRQAVHQLRGAEPLRVVDPDTQTTYVLVRAEIYDQLQAESSNEDDLAATYPAQIEAALKAGWSAPEMDVYDNYDESRRKLCP